MDHVTQPCENQWYPTFGVYPRLFDHHVVFRLSATKNPISIIQKNDIITQKRLLKFLMGIHCPNRTTGLGEGTDYVSKLTPLMVAI